MTRRLQKILKNSLLICDDIEAYSNKKTVMKIMNLIILLTTGRHFNISLLFLVHNATQGNMTKLLLLESHGIIIPSKYEW